MSDPARDGTSRRAPALPRRIGPADAAALVIANVVGAGIFVTPGIVAALVPAEGPFFAVWVAGGLLALAGALAYAELAALLPKAGGEYVYIREAFGPLAGFLTGWTSFAAGFSGAIAAAAVALAEYVGRVVPAAGDATPLASLALGPLTLSISRRGLTALAVIAAFTLLHRRGVRVGRLVQNALTGAKVLALAALGATCRARSPSAPASCSPSTSR
jgi:APA family basic amino acid/polyamine antiporter